ncbi:probable endo-1,3(4)-beta-glucanase ARB_01444 [Eucalyptus grandis]|uniref:probable endo-1,3(4)-beta-glucanase ARB_01444 n=1 Tax=Eucalyptus grandis TaxID=71139 RepID=UPI00192E87C2|nr:probable endo-1,3(4)-beta-glucanase ARB_01444 [Eucalyptus grandis]
MAAKAKAFPFVFPRVESPFLPNPSPFFSPSLISARLPTNSFFQNFALNNGDQAEYIHPYLVKPSPSSVSVSFPSCVATSTSLYQVFNADLTISAVSSDDAACSSSAEALRHVISSYSDLGVTLDFAASNLKFILVRGSPYLTCLVNRRTEVAISTIHAILLLSSNSSRTKHTLKLNNNQTWLVYTSSLISFSHSLNAITSGRFSGVIRIAYLPDGGSFSEEVLDKFSSSYALSGDAVLTKPFCLEYKWEKRGWGNLLMLAHPLHVRLLSREDCRATVLEDFKYRSIDGDLVGVVGDSWVLRSNPVSVTWHSIRGIREESHNEIIQALRRDVASLNPATLTTISSYFYGKLMARAARLALIAEEVCYPEVIPTIGKYLKSTIEPWLDGTFSGNGFLYDAKWGGIITKLGSTNPGEDLGFGLYNAHHYHLGYFLYAIAVLAKIDPAWGRKYRPQAYSLMADFMNLGRRWNSNYPRLRCFDLYKLHSWASGLTEFGDGRNQESTSEAVNAYYSAALMGLAYGDTHLVTVGSTLVAMEIQAAQTWWHVREGDNLYEEDFTRENRVVGVLWANKRDSGLWFAGAERRDCRLGIQVLPLSPITEVLFSDIQFSKQLVDWTYPSLNREGIEGWRGFVCALEGIFDQSSALEKVRSLSGFDDGNSISNLLWWIHSRGDEEET